MYELLRDFAGPLATVLVAIFVGLISWRHNARQTRIAEDELKIKLFERRYQIYAAARHILQELMNCSFDDVDDTKIMDLLVTIREGHFFFGGKAASFLDHVYDLAETMMADIHILRVNCGQVPVPLEHGGIDCEEMFKNVRGLQKNMSAELLKMPDVFENDLGFKRFR